LKLLEGRTHEEGAMIDRLGTSALFVLMLAQLFACARVVDVGALEGPDGSPRGATMDAMPQDAGPPVVGMDAGPRTHPNPNPPMPATEGACSRAIGSSTTWCWLNPLPQGNDLVAAAFMGGEVWMVGARGTLLHFDGTRYSNVSVPTTASLTSIWLDGAGGGWIVGEGGLLFSLRNLDQGVPNIEAVSLPRSVPSLDRVWGLDANDVWVVGAGGAIFRWDGALWTDQSIANGDDLRAIFGVSRTDVWAAGRNGFFAHYDGRGWQNMTPAAPISDDFNSIWGTSANDLWAVAAFRGEVNRSTIYHYQGSTWTPVPPITGVASSYAEIWGSGADDIWAVGSYHNLQRTGSSAMAHYHGGAWSIVTSPNQESIQWVGGTGSNDAWAIGAYGAILHGDGTRWTTISTTLARPGAAAPASNTSLWGSSASDVYAVGLGTVLHYDGARWSYVDTSPGQVTSAIWGNGPSDVWIGGAGDDPGSTLVHFDGTRWSSISPAFINVQALWGSGPTDVWAGSAYGMVLHYDGQQWSVLPSAGTYPTASLWGSGPSDLWSATGNAGVMTHYDGHTWSMVQIPDQILSQGISGTAADDVWVIGAQSGSEILHFSGSIWAKLWGSSTTDPRGPLGIFARARNDAWAVGSAGFVLHWDGSTWSAADAKVGHDLYGVWSDPSGAHVWVSGEGGAILERQ
jgi:hypothetical protein